MPLIYHKYFILETVIINYIFPILVLFHLQFVILYFLFQLDLAGIVNLLKIFFEVPLMPTEHLLFLLIYHNHFFVIWILFIEIILNLLKLIFLLFNLCLNLLFIFLLTRFLSSRFHLKRTFSLRLKTYIYKLIFKDQAIIVLLQFKIFNCFSFIFNLKMVNICWSYFVRMHREF